ncbi:MAG: sensor domain-containing diguanylate cyclase [Acidobacteria bacterium]|nr:sensor domain-containing diguanylate cyclase [Acidobacteriota bacterium]
MANETDIFRDLLDCLVDGVYFTDTERRIAFWNKGAETLSGFSREEVVGKRCLDNLLMHVDASGKELCKNGCPLSETLQDGMPREADVFLHHKNGHRVPVRVRVAPMKNEAGAIVGAVEIFSDNTANVQLSQRLAQMERLALLDSLTGLANRRYLESIVRSRLEELRRNNWPFGILFIDIDNFKSINDKYGHEIGDQVIKMTSRTLDATSRAFDVVGRWGGEEFVAVIANAETNELFDVGERMRSLVEHSMLSAPEYLFVTVSVGGAQAVPDDTIESLVKRADDKLYQAKHSGKNCVFI